MLEPNEVSEEEIQAAEDLAEIAGDIGKIIDSFDDVWVDSGYDLSGG